MANVSVTQQDVYDQKWPDLTPGDYTAVTVNSQFTS